MRKGLIFFILCLAAISGCADDEAKPVYLDEDVYDATPSSPNYETRLRTFIALHHPGRENVRGPYASAAYLAFRGTEPPGGLLAAIQGSLDEINERIDTADFDMNGLLRILYQFEGSGLLDADFLEAAEASVLGFKYWPDELADADPTAADGQAPDSMCSWTENHFILFSANAYLAGQRYPDAVFPAADHRGAEKMAIFRPRILRWLDLRFRTGFSEWLSNVYYEEDLAALLNLVDFCEDEEIVKRAVMVTDLLLADIALNQFRGTFGSSHGRSYERHKKDGANDSTGSVLKLISGMNRFKFGNMGAVCLALSDGYEIPSVLFEIATDMDRPETINRQRMGILLEEADRWGLDFDRLEDGMTFLTLEAYTHEKTIALFVRMLNEYNWWENSFFGPFKDYRDLLESAGDVGLLEPLAALLDKDLTRNMRPEVDLYTYRTPDFMLSSAQDYRKGYGGDQQHPWQATLGHDAVCFTTHPAKWVRDGEENDDSPNYWTGTGSLPRVAQVENVAIILHNINTLPGLYLTHELVFTHAWLPRNKFDEVVEENGWIFARKGDAYLALWSQNPYVWQDEGPDMDAEIIVDGRKNAWICELGRRAVDGEFADFRARIASARLDNLGLNVWYDSPSQGTLHFSWKGPLKQDSRTVDLHDYGRYDNPYCQADFASDTIRFEANGAWLDLDDETLTREASGFMDRE